MAGEWVCWVVQGRAEAAAGQEAAGDADRAEGFEAVGVLDDAGFQ